MPIDWIWTRVGNEIVLNSVRVVLHQNIQFRNFHFIIIKVFGHLRFFLIRLLYVAFISNYILHRPYSIIYVHNTGNYFIYLLLLIEMNRRNTLFYLFTLYRYTVFILINFWYFMVKDNYLFICVCVTIFL